MENPGRVYGGLTPDERHGRRRDQLLDAGLEVFAAKGWSGASVLDVCRSAHLSQRYFYEHFTDREELFLAVSGRIAAEVDEVVRAAAVEPGASAEERARGVLGGIASYFAADPRTVRVALVESFATPRLREHRAQLITLFGGLGARLMRSLRDHPRRAANRSLELSALVLAGGMVEAIIAASATEDAPDPRELVDHLTRLWTAAAALADVG